MSQFKVMTIVGTRPELIKLSRVIAELDQQVGHVLVHTGQNYNDELNKVFFDDLEIRKPDIYLDAARDTAAETIAQVISKIDPVLESHQPNAVLFYGDTNSCMAAIPAKRRKIPVFHMEAGNRCFDERVPEEINRRIIDHISDINMPLTEHARRYLIAEGIKPDSIIKTGSCMQEVLEYYQDKIDRSNILNELELQNQNYFVVSSHREENVDSDTRLTSLLESLNKLVSEYNIPVIFSVHPRTRKRLDALTIKIDPNIRFMKALGFFDYIQLQKHARCVLSDSGTIAEESSLLKFPAVTLRQAHERPEGMDEGTLIMSDVDSDELLLAVNTVLNQSNEQGFDVKTVTDYEGGQVSKKVVRIILSYTSFVNRTVWRQ